MHISSAGPVRVRDRPRASTTRSPPGRCTMTGLSHQPRATATAATATDDDPDAVVSPAPRSHTRRSDLVASRRGATSWTFVRSGKRGCVSISGPSRSRSLARRRVAAGRRHVGCRPTAVVNSTASRRRRSSRARRRRPRPCPCSTSSAVEHPRARPSRAARTIATSARAGAAASQRAAMRVPLPDISADRAVGVPDHASRLALVDARRPRATPSAPMPRLDVAETAHALRRELACLGAARRRGSCYRARATSRSARPHLTVDDRSRRSYRGAGRRAGVPRAGVESAARRQVENRGHHVHRRTVCVDDDEPRDPPHPFPLVGSVLARPHDDPVTCFVGPGACAISAARAPCRRFRDRRRPAPAATSSTTPRVEHRVGARGRSAARARPVRRRARR